MSNNNLIIHENIKKKLKNMISRNRIPHILFHGTTGGGKRTLLKYLINNIYNFDKDKINKNTLYIDCVHGKGIYFIRNILKFFAKSNIKNKIECKFKSIILLNAGKLTGDAQSALRRCIERFSHSTRFFVVIENKNKLLLPIISRFCSIYVPSPKINNKYQNLYSYHKIKYLQDEKYKYIWFKNQISIKKPYSSIDKCIKFSLQLYEKGYYAYLLLDYIENDSSISPEKKYYYLIFFEKIRSEFRNEKLLMFIILFLFYMRPKCDLEI